MHGLPKGLDLSFFVGNTLTSITFATNVICFNFDGGVGINLESSFQHQQKAEVERGDVGTIQSVYLIPTSALMSLTNHAVVDVVGSDDGTLTLKFDDGQVLKCIEEPIPYESYNFTDGKQSWYV